MLIQLMFQNTFYTSQILKNVFDLDLKILSTFNQFVKMQTWHFYLLSLIEICLVKYWLKYVRKRLICMDENFFVTSLTIINIMVSISFSFAKIMLGERIQSSEVEGNNKLG